MPSRGNTSAETVGSSKAEWAVKRALIRGRIVAFGQDRSVRLHLRYVEPAVSGVVSDAVALLCLTTARPSLSSDTSVNFSAGAGVAIARRSATALGIDTL